MAKDYASTTPALSTKATTTTRQTLHTPSSAAAVGRILSHGEPVYGINTGFGKLGRNSQALVLLKCLN